MKKLLLTLAAVSAVSAASAATLELQWSAANTELGEKAFSAPVALDNEGNVVAAVPTGANMNASIVFYAKADGSVLRSYEINGAVSVNAIAFDKNNDMFIAGTLADEVEFHGVGTTDIILQGMMIDGAATTEKNASFIVKYNAAGDPVASTVFSPVIRDEYASALDPAASGTVFFSINDLKVSDDNVYASAIYTGITTPAEGVFSTPVVFDGGFNSMWFGMFITDLKACTVFALDSDLKNGSVILDTKVKQNLETEDDLYQALSIAFDVVGSDVYAGIVGYGDLAISHAGGSTDFAPSADNRDIIYNYGVYNKAGLVKQLPVKAYTNINKSKNNTIRRVLVAKDGTVYGVGSIHTETPAPTAEDANATVLGAELLVNMIIDGSDAVSAVNKEFINGTTTAEEVLCATILPDGNIVIGAADYFNMSSETNKGEFAGKTSVYTFNGSELSASDIFSDMIAVAVKVGDVAEASTAENGVTVALYNDPSAAGIEDIVIDENAPIEYFNLQGVRVANPENGLYIVRQGKNVTKQIIRK